MASKLRTRGRGFRAASIALTFVALLALYAGCWLLIDGLFELASGAILLLFCAVPLHRAIDPAIALLERASIALGNSTWGPLGRARREDALFWKPDELPEVEPELRGPPPRPRHGFHATRPEDAARLGELQRSALATTAWVVQTFGDPSPVDAYGHTSGSTQLWLAARFAFFDELGRIAFGFVDVSELLQEEDRTNSPHSSPETRHTWVLAHLQRSKSFTVLHPPGRPERAEVYGWLDPHLQTSLSDAARTPGDPSARRARVSEALREATSRARLVLQHGDGLETPGIDPVAARELVAALRTHLGVPDRLLPQSPALDAALDELATALVEGKLAPSLVAQLDSAASRLGTSTRWAARWERA